MKTLLLHRFRTAVAAAALLLAVPVISASLPADQTVNATVDTSAPVALKAAAGTTATPAAMIQATAQLSLAAATATVVPMPSITKQQGSVTVGSNYIQVNEDGWYDITAGIHFYNTATSARKFAAFGFGTTVTASYDASGPINDQTPTSAYTGMNLSQSRYMTSGTKVWVVVYTTVAMPINYDFTFLSLVKVA